MDQPSPQPPAAPAATRSASFSAALGATTIAFSSILVKLSGSSPTTSSIYRCAYALPALGWLAWREDRRFGRRSWRQRGPALGSGLFFVIDLILWTQSIEDVGADLATVLANVQVVLLPLVAWVLLGERPARRVLVALPVALAGVVLISGVFERGAYGRHPVAGAVYGLGAGIAYVGFLMLLRRGGADRRRAAGPLFDAIAVATVLGVLTGLVLGDTRFVPAWPSAGWLLALAFGPQVFGWLMITTSLPRLPAATTSLLLMIQPVGSVVLAAIILGERPSVVQLAGVMVVLVAVVFAARSRPAAA